MGEQNRQRKKAILVYLYDEELKILNETIQRLHMTKSNYIRKLILLGGVPNVPKLPEEQMERFLFELNRIGNNINQIAYQANAQRSTGRREVRELKERFDELLCLYDQWAYK